MSQAQLRSLIRDKGGKSERREVIAALRCDRSLLVEIPSAMLADREFILEVLWCFKIDDCNRLLCLAHKSVKADKQFMLRVVQVSETLLQHAVDELKRDRDFMLRAFRISHHAFQC